MFPCSKKGKSGKVATVAAKPKEGAEEVELEKTEESVEYAAFRNQRLGTPRMLKLMNKKDAGFMLKDQINESMLRVNAAKFGHSIEEIAPQYTNSYYLPDKSQYVPEKQVCKGAKRNGVRHYSQHMPEMPKGSNHGSRFDEKVRSMQSGLNMTKNASPNRMSFAK